MSKLTDALSQRHNPSISFGNSEHPLSRKEFVNAIGFLIENRDHWEDLGRDQFEIAQHLAHIIDSFGAPPPEKEKKR
jgi:hypothetical protein